MKDLSQFLIGIGVLLIGVALLIFAIRYKPPMTFSDIMNEVTKGSSRYGDLMKKYDLEDTK